MPHQRLRSGVRRLDQFRRVGIPDESVDRGGPNRVGRRGRSPGRCDALTLHRGIRHPGSTTMAFGRHRVARGCERACETDARRHARRGGRVGPSRSSGCGSAGDGRLRGGAGAGCAGLRRNGGTGHLGGGLGQPGPSSRLPWWPASRVPWWPASRGPWPGPWQPASPAAGLAVTTLVTAGLRAVGLALTALRRSPSWRPGPSRPTSWPGAALAAAVASSNAAAGGVLANRRNAVQGRSLGRVGLRGRDNLAVGGQERESELAGLVLGERELRGHGASRCMGRRLCVADG